MTANEIIKYKKILIIRLSSLGDILLTTPMIRALKNLNSSFEIDFLLKENYRDTLVYNPNLAELLILKSNSENWNEIRKKIREKNYDLILDLQNNIRSFRLIWGLSCPKLKFRKYSFLKFLLVNFKYNLMKHLPQIAVRYSGVIEGLRLDADGLDLISMNKPDESLFKLKIPIGICPGSRHFTKMWPKEYFIELADLLIQNGYDVILFGGESDKQACYEIESAVRGITNRCNDNQVLQTIAEMRLCKAIICNDSGLMHTACAAKVPVIALYGSTVKEFGFTPYKNKNLILENNSLTCRPCSHIGRSGCPKQHFKCMREIKPLQVFNSLKDFISL
ncbi:MAG: glycosyltransferase family 9 protein [Ignavibacteriaceae bacterium]|nr:glycosyltransferase family 9 protein [Ignavibacteriaceae bacterium]